MAPILDIEVECGEQKSRLLRGMVVLRGTVNYCIYKKEIGDGDLQILKRVTFCNQAPSFVSLLTPNAVVIARLSK